MCKTIKAFNKEHLTAILKLLEKGNTITSIHKSFEEKFDVEIKESTFRNWVNKSFTNRPIGGSNKWICTNYLYSQNDFFDLLDNDSIKNTQETSECKSENDPQKIPQPPSDENPPNTEKLPGHEKIITVLKGDSDNLTSTEKKQSIKDPDEIEILQKNISGALFKLEVLEKKVLSIAKMMTTHMQENEKQKKLMRQIITLIYDEMIKKE